MAKTSLYIALVAALYILASALSASAARDSRECSRDVDCTWICEEGGLCYENGTCFCWPSVTENRVLKCKRDIECYFQCPKGGFCDLKKGVCGCFPGGQAHSAGAPANVLHCNRDIECQLKCGPKGGFCNDKEGTCYCLPPEN